MDTSNGDTALEPCEFTSWTGLLRAHSVITRQLDVELGSQHGITLSDFEVLQFLAHAPDQRMRMSELSDSVLISQSGITRLVDRLQRRGFVDREQCAADRRGSYAVLTPEGMERFREAERTHAMLVRANYLGKLTPDEQQQLTALWERLIPGTSLSLNPAPETLAG